MASTPPYKPLSVQTIHAAIDRICNGSSFRRAPIIKDDLYGITDGTTTTTFYLAYSTWDGRILYADRQHDTTFVDENSTATDHHKIYPCLAAIAVELQCQRLTWQYIDAPVSFPEPLFPPVETLHGWLTLHWRRESYATATVTESLAQSCPTTATSSADTILKHCCSVSSFFSTTDDFVIRIAETDADLQAITRLVQGLADFEKEPDAVNTTADHFRTDGFAGDNGKKLFYCLLMEKDKYVFGMAFLYLGCTNHEGRFLYLEDLFIEEPYRGKGTGTRIMKTLATCAVALECSRVVWQALDWNTPAITFYRKLGAAVVDGLVTARFAGKDLQRVAHLWNEKKNDAIA